MEAKTTRKRKKHSEEFKREAVRLLETRGERTVADVAGSLGVAENLLHAWKKKFGSAAEQLRKERGGETPDLYSRRVVGWALRKSLNRDLAVSTLEHALACRRPLPGLVHHTDRGCQYASAEYRALLERHGAACSMSAAGDCWDNAVAESFFATLKKELVHGCAFETRSEAYDSISDYIDNYYNPKRRHSAAGNLSPINFELANVAELAA